MKMQIVCSRYIRPPWWELWEREREQGQASSDRSAVYSQHASGEEAGRIQWCNTRRRNSSTLWESETVQDKDSVSLHARDGADVTAVIAGVSCVCACAEVKDQWQCMLHEVKPSWLTLELNRKTWDMQNLDLYSRLDSQVCLFYCSSGFKQILLHAKVLECSYWSVNIVR